MENRHPDNAVVVFTVVFGDQTFCPVSTVLSGYMHFEAVLIVCIEQFYKRKSHNSQRLKKLDITKRSLSY